MRIQIVGDSLTANAVRCGLQMARLAITDTLPDYTIEFTETHKDVPVIDGVDCEIERLIINSIASVAKTDIYLARQGGIQSDNKIIISIPRFSEPNQLKLIEKAVIQGVQKFFHFNKLDDKKDVELESKILSPTTYIEPTIITKEIYIESRLSRWEHFLKFLGF